MVHGVSDGRLLVSEDGVDRSERSAPRIADLAVDPADPDRLLATTERGLVVTGRAGIGAVTRPARPPRGRARTGLSRRRPAG